MTAACPHATGKETWRPPGRPEGLYLHVPFCVRKCHYCDFYSLAQRNEQKAPEAGRYLDAVAAELGALPAGFRPRTIFVGGGTPTELAAADLERLLGLIRTHVDLSDLLEWTCESNPGTLTRDKVRLLRQAGVTRVSLGVQSFDAQNLAFLGRIHGPREALDGFALLREEGVTNVNLDLIAAIPGSSTQKLLADLRQAVSLGPEHISCYSLIFEEGTPLYSQRQRGQVRAVHEDEELCQYRQVQETLGAAGYQQYEISNYCAERGDGRDLRCLHNLLYWGPGQFFALGPAAHGHVDGARYGNVRDLERYCDAILGVNGAPPRPQAARVVSERLDPKAWAREALVCGLRLSAGVDRVAFLAQTGFFIDAIAGPAIRRMQGAGLLEVDGASVRLTQRGLVLSDTVFAEII